MKIVRGVQSVGRSISRVWAKFWDTYNNVAAVLACLVTGIGVVLASIFILMKSASFVLAPMGWHIPGCDGDFGDFLKTLFRLG